MTRHFLDLFDLSADAARDLLDRAVDAEARRPARAGARSCSGADARPALREAVAADPRQLRGGDRPARRQRDLPARQGRRPRRPRERRRLRPGHQPVRRRPGRADLRPRDGRGAGPARDDPGHQRPVRRRPPCQAMADLLTIREDVRPPRRGQARLRRRRQQRGPVAGRGLGPAGARVRPGLPARLRLPGRLPRPVRGGLPRRPARRRARPGTRGRRGRRRLHRRLGQHGPGGTRPSARRAVFAAVPGRRRPARPRAGPTRSSSTACPPTAARK